MPRRSQIAGARAQANETALDQVVELTPKVYKRMLREFTPAQAKITVDKWIAKHRKDYSSSNKKLWLGTSIFAYDPEKEVSKKLRTAIFKQVFSIAGKQLSKAEQKRWKNREKMMSENVVQEYRRMASSNRVQKFYK